MSNNLSDFIFRFEQDHQATFSVVKQALEDLESNCYRRNRKSSLEEAIEIDAKAVNDPGAKSQSVSSIDKFTCGSRTTADSSNCIEPWSETQPIGSLDNLIELKNIPSYAAKTLPVISEGESNTPTPMKRERKSSLSSDFSPVKDYNKEFGTCRSVKPLAMRMPFFALNIKTLNIRECVSVVEIDSLGGGKEHSPIIQPILQYTVSDPNLDHPSDPESPAVALPLSDDGEKKIRSPTRFVRSQKPNPRLDLDDDGILEEDFLRNILMIEKSYTSRREIFQQIMEYVFSNKNLQENAHKNHPRKEVIYSRNICTRELLKNLNCLISSLSKEEVSIQLNIINEKRFLETQFERFLRSKGITPDFINSLKDEISVDETEIKAIYERIVKISNYLKYRSNSKEIVRKNLFYFKKLLDRFPPNFLNSNDRAPTDPETEIKFITVRKLIEKATEVVDTLIAEKLKYITILTYDHFIKPLSLLLLLTKRYYTPRPIMMTDEEYNLFKVHNSNTRRKRIIELLTFWVDNRPNDFIINSDLLALLIIFLDSILKLDKEQVGNKDLLDLYVKAEDLIESSNCKVKKELLRPLIRKTSRIQGNANVSAKPIFSGQRKQKFTQDSLKAEPTSSLISIDRVSCPGETNEKAPSEESGTRRTVKSLRRSPFSARSIKLSKGDDDANLILDWEVEDIAKQLTLIDMKIFQKIQINQMMLKRWTKAAYSEECKEIHDGIRRFNSLSFWVQYVSINACNPVQRFTILNKFIAIAAECLKLNNFSSSHSIFLALERLQNIRIWKISEQNKENWKTLEKNFHSATIFQDMENTLKSLQEPAIPSITFFTNRFFRLQDDVNFQIKREDQRKYLKSAQLAQLAEYALLLKKFQSNRYEISKNFQMYSFLKKDYKEKDEIDFEDEGAEEILRTRIMGLTCDREL